ncbi:hypothetical protein WME91_30625 [Sorangium sp. So ce269]
MIVKVGYNMNDAAAQEQNQKQIQAYTGKSGLPDLSTPLMVENVTNLKTNNLIDNGKGVIVPPNTYLSFNISFGCQVGFAYGIEILPSSIAIVDDNVLMVAQPSVQSSNDWLTITQYAFIGGNQYNGEMIYVYDNAFGTHQISQQIADNSYQVRVTCYPVISWTDSHNNTHGVDRVNLDTPAAPPPTLNGLVVSQDDGDINVHPGTIGGQGQSGQKYGSCNGWNIDRSQSTSVVFDVFVINQKYYSTEYYQVLSRGGDLSD